jgi:UDP-perosamine 4-acetyltransferase
LIIYVEEYLSYKCRNEGEGRPLQKERWIDWLKVSMSSEFLLNTIRNIVAIDRATSACTSGLQVGQTVYFSDPAASRVLRLTGFSRPESDGRWTDGTLATIDLKLAPESVEIGRLRLHMMPFVTEDKGQTLRLRCGEGPEQVVEFFSGTLAWRMVDLPLTGVRADTSVRIQIAVAHAFVPSKLGISPDPRALGVMIRRIELVSNAVAEDLVPLAIGSSITLSSADAELMIRLTGFSGPEPDGRWTDSASATIDLKLAPESVETGCLRLYLMPFVTEDKGQTLRLRCGEGPEQVVEFLAGTLAWRTVELPLAGVRADSLVRIQIAVAHPFVPSKLGISRDARALGVMVKKIDLLSNTVPDRIDEEIGEQPRELPIQSTLEAEGLVPVAVGTSISVASLDAGRMIRLTGFSELEPDGRWTDGNAATITLKLANPTASGCLRLYFTPFVTPHTGQSIRIKCGDGKEITRSYSAGPRREAMLDLPLSRTTSNDEISISIIIEAPISPASTGLGADERRLGIQLHRMEFVAGVSRFTSFARWALRSLIRPMRRLVLKSRDFFTRPVVERIAQLDKQILERGDARLTVFRTELARLNSEEFAKQASQIDTVIRAIEDLPTRSEFTATGTRLAALEQALSKLEQIVGALHEKTDVVMNRSSRFLFPVDDNMVLVRSPVGYLYCSRNDHAVLSCLADSGEFEPGLRRLLERVLEPGMVFLDVGAHLGLHTLTAARRVGNSGRVFSFEPTPTTHDLLCRTLKLNEFDDRVTVWRAAAGRKDTDTPLYVGAISGHNSLYPFPSSETTVEVKVVQLDKALPSGHHIDVAKIDVEGAELDVLCGMSRIITENPGILIIAEYGPSHLARTGIAPKDWLSAFSSQGFQGYVIEEPSGNCVPIEQVDLSDVFSVNIAFIRSKSPLHPRLTAGAPARAPVVVIGAGGHAKVVIELIRAQGLYDVMGCTDREPEQRDVVGAPILGSDDVLPDLYARGIRHCFVALGDNALRHKVAAQVTALGFQLVNAISPKAIVSPSARIGRGVAVMGGAVINADATIGDLAIVNTRATVDHECQIGEAAHVAPRAALAGSVRIGPLAFVGVGATIVPGISVGESTVIGAGATVISDLGPNIVAVGVPAKPLQRTCSEQQVDHGEQS